MTGKAGGPIAEAKGEIIKGDIGKKAGIGASAAAMPTADHALKPADRKFVTALARGLDVLSAFRARDGFLGNQEIAERTGLPKATVTRITYTLCQLGYLTLVPRLGKYQLAPGAITLGYAALANLGIRQIARPHMDMLAEQFHAPVALGVLFRECALYIDISRGSATFSIQLDVGARLPLATTAIGRALLAGMAPEARARCLVQLADIYGPQWPDVKAGLDAALDHYGQHGFVYAKGDWREDIHAVGAPLVAADGSGIFAVNCGAPPHHFPIERLQEEVGPRVVDLVRLVEASLSGGRRSTG